MTKSPIILGCPTYNGQLHHGTARSLYATACEARHVQVFVNEGSLLNDNCNKIWATALNNRDGMGAKWFAMLHADIEPEPWWLDKLVAEAEKHDADFLSACIALKNDTARTSTAIASEDGDLEQAGRISFRQLWHETFPETFDVYMAADALENLPMPLRVENCPRSFLLANTGCMVCRMDRPWCEAVDDLGCLKVIFDSISAIHLADSGHGLWQNYTLSEDWLFAMRIAQEGGKVMCTRIVGANHIGPALFQNGREMTTYRNAVNNEIINKAKLAKVA